MTKLVVEAFLVALAPFVLGAAARAIRFSTSSDPKGVFPTQEPVHTVRGRTLEV